MTVHLKHMDSSILQRLCMVYLNAAMLISVPSGEAELNNGAYTYM